MQYMSDTGTTVLITNTSTAVVISDMTIRYTIILDIDLARPTRSSTYRVHKALHTRTT